MDDQIEVRQRRAVETTYGQINEVLAKVLCPNRACIVHAITEFRG